MGIAIDILIALFIVWSLFRGWQQGFLYQLGTLALLVLAYFVGRGLGGLLTDPIASTGLSVSISASIGFFAIFLIVMIIGAIFLKKITKDLLKDAETATKVDKSLGITLGGAKGLLIAYLVVVALIMAHRLTGKIPIPFGDSYSGRWIMANNFLDSDEFPRLKAIAKLGFIVSTRDADDLAKDPHVHAILTHPKAEVLNKPEIIKAAMERDIVTLLGSSELWDFLDEPAIQGHLDAMAWVEPDEAAAPAPSPVTP